MKIANQLLNTDSSTGVKTVASLDSGAVFHGIFTAAAAAGEVASRKDSSQIKAKPQISASKAQISDVKKKLVASDSADANAPKAVVIASQQDLSDTANQLSMSSRSASEFLTLSAGQTLHNSQGSAENIGGKVPFSSSSPSIAPTVQSATNTSNTERTNQKTVDVELTEASRSDRNLQVTAPDDQQGLDSNVTSPQAELATLQVTTTQPSADALSTTAVAPLASETPVSLPAIESAKQGPVDATPNIDAPSKHTPELAAAGRPQPAALGAIASDPKFGTAQIHPVQTVRDIPPATTASRPATQVSSHAIGSVVSPAPAEISRAAQALPNAVPAASPTAPVTEVPVSSAESTPLPGSLKVAGADQISPTSKSSDISSSTPDVTAADPTSVATQLSASAVTQSVTAVSLPFAGFSGESQSTPAIAPNRTAAVGTGNQSIKGDGSRPTNSAVKAKPGSGSSVTSNRFSDSDASDIQAASASATTAASVSKVLEAPIAGSQGANDVKTSFDLASLHQISQVEPVTVANHTPQTSQNVIASTSTTVQSPPLQAAQDSLPMQGVSSAQLVQSMRASEMKLGMQSAEFGNISISTSLNHQALSAQISIDHSELGRALAVHLPAIEEKLGSAYGVQARVELRDSNSPSSSSDSGYSNSGQQSREQRQSQSGESSVSPSAMLERVASRASFTSSPTTASVSRLDIRI